jgi:hypothetical protein
MKLLMAKAAKEGAGNGGGAQDLGLTGAGVERKVIPGLDDALRDYRTKRDTRMAATKEEVKAKDAVLTLFHANAEALADAKGVLRYKVEYEAEEIEVFIEPAKEKIKFGKQDKPDNDA